MALSYNTTIRDSQLQVVANAIDAGSGPGLIRIYTGPRPATGATITTEVLLAELTFSDPVGPSATGGVLTASAIADDAGANANGLAAWFRIVDSLGTFVMDGTVGTTSAADLVMNTLDIVTGIPVSITSFVITAGNA